MIILGIDPGTTITGYGIIEAKKRGCKPKVFDFGCILTKTSSNQGEKLKKIHNNIRGLIEKYKPDLMSVESLYFFKNLKTAIPVSQAKGVILLSAAQRNIPVMEFTPLQMKMAVVGYGKAEKKQVQKMTKELLDLSGFNLEKEGRKKDDATDALGIALCALYSLKSINLKTK